MGIDDVLHVVLKRLIYLSCVQNDEVTDSLTFVRPTEREGESQRLWARSIGEGGGYCLR